MQNITHVLTTDQTELQGLPERQAAARRNIGVKVVDVHNSAGESVVVDGIAVIPDPTGNNSWKQWSEDHGSLGDNSIYIGAANVLAIQPSIALGYNNTSTYVNASQPRHGYNILLGNSNSATDATYAFQLGINNIVNGETDPNTSYPLALNLGNHNQIWHTNDTTPEGDTVPVKDAEGVNIGKNNYTYRFGINLGQNNYAFNAGVSIGEQNSSNGASCVIGVHSNGDGKSIAIGDNAVSSGNAFAIGSGASAHSNAVSIGFGTYANNSGVAIGRYAIAGNAAFCVGFGSSSSHATANDGSICLTGGSSRDYSAYGSIIIGTCNTDDQSPNEYNYASGASVIIGSRNYANNRGIIVGDNNNGTNFARIFGDSNSVNTNTYVFGSNNYSNSGYGVMIGRRNSFNGSNTAYNVAVGENNRIGYEAYAFGRDNEVGGWSMAFGVNNRDTPYGNFNHSTMIGYDNKSASNLDRLAKMITMQIDPATYDYHQFDDKYIAAKAPYLDIADEYLSSAEYDIVMEFERAEWEYLTDLTIVHPTSYTQEQYDDAIATLNSMSYAHVSSENKAIATTLKTELRDLLQKMVYDEDYPGPTSQDYIDDYNTYVTKMHDLYGLMNTYYAADVRTVFSNYMDWFLDNLIHTTDQSKWGVPPLDIQLLRACLEHWDNSVDAEAYTTPSMSMNDYSTYIIVSSTKNTIFSTLRDVRSHDAPYETEEQVFITCNSILMGSDNYGVHHNSILIGAANKSDAATNIQTPGDDDGFCTAIGFSNTVGRNYDFAYGYMSTAQGGENVAFQHSTAIGYRNVAMIDASLKGTGNVGLVESAIRANNVSRDPDTAMFTHNFLVGGTLTSSTDYADTRSGMHHNVILSSLSDLYAKSGASANFIYGGRGGDSRYKISMSAADSGSIDSNIFLGNTQSACSIQTKSGVAQSLIVEPIRMTIKTGFVSKNVFLNADINISNGSLNMFHTVQHNFVHSSKITGQYYALMNNVLFSNSSIESDSNDAECCVIKNILFNESRLVNTADVSVWNRQVQPSSENVLIGSIASNVYGCFSMGDLSSVVHEFPYITDCLRVFNFGDNTVARTIESAVFGTNTVYTAKNSFVFGKSNQVNGNLNSTFANANGYFDSTVVFGQQNVLNASNQSRIATECEFVHGNVNTLNECASVQVFGSNNTIGYGNDPTPSETISDRAEYDAAVASSTRTVIKTSTPMPIPFTNGGTTNTTDMYVVGHGHVDKTVAPLYTNRDFVAGTDNRIYKGIMDTTVFGSHNTVSGSGMQYANTFIQGEHNVANSGSGIVIMGCGSVADGHGAIAIGTQLIANQWQTVVGKYNQSVAGPERLVSGSLETDKALFVIGNGYADSDGEGWDVESNIHRSNAMVVYADGTVNAHDFVSDNELTIDGQNGISVTEDLVNSKVVVSLDSATADIINFLKSKPSQGTYAIQSTDGVLSWVAIGLV